MENVKQDPESEGAKPPSRGGWVLLVFAIPLLLYLVVLEDSRDQEVERFHHEIFSFRQEVLQRLSSGTRVVVGATEAPQRGESLAWRLAAQESDDTLVEVVTKYYFGTSLKPYLPCSIAWTAAPDILQLNFAIDRMMPRSEFGSTSKRGEDRRLRFEGNIDLQKALVRIADPTVFDALLLADSQGELILQLGNDAGHFPSLPYFSTGWGDAIEKSPKSRSSPTDLFDAGAGEAVQREIGGINYTLFPTEITLRPELLLGGPLYCRAANPVGGHETLRLRAVGLVRTERLTASWLRPAEPYYWYFLLFYLAVFFGALFNDLLRLQAQGKFFWQREDPAVDKGHGSVNTAKTLFSRMATSCAWLSFGTTLGLLLAFVFVVRGLAAWEVERLSTLAREVEANTSLQLKMARDAMEHDSKTHWVERFAEYEYEKTGKAARIVKLETGWREKLRSINIGSRAYLENLRPSVPLLDFVISKADGGKNLILAMSTHEPRSDYPGQNKGARTAALHLLAFEQAAMPKDFGATLVMARGLDGPWDVMIDSARPRQQNIDFLEEFSRPDCLRARTSREGYCEGRLAGLRAKVRVAPLTNSMRKFDFVGKGEPLLITYSYLENRNSQLEAVIWISTVLALLFANLILGPFFAKSLTGSPWRCPENSSIQHRSLIIAVVSGFAIFLLCWAIEDRLFFGLNDLDRSERLEEFKALVADEPLEAAPIDQALSLAQWGDLANPVPPNWMPNILPDSFVALYRSVRPEQPRQIKYTAELRMERNSLVRGSRILSPPGWPWSFSWFFHCCLGFLGVVLLLVVIRYFASYLGSLSLLQRLLVTAGAIFLLTLNVPFLGSILVASLGWLFDMNGLIPKRLGEWLSNSIPSEKP